jgi:hypothetical protein
MGAGSESGARDGAGVGGGALAGICGAAGAHGHGVERWESRPAGGIECALINVQCSDDSMPGARKCVDLAVARAYVCWCGRAMVRGPAKERKESLP